ncbi:hypothetical protein B0T24DRAFT_688502 [Lasiosphaeria ovina]|uniref:Uncharacterized protein n=1 Tax=Lasiosphaeria ovina TaxID=92902 RepID=A0AAE0NLP9_9PEZI|nr:hypothetical protein B0T24DRAFT_688502 [Lasiosphaeria ovina]
MSRSIPPEIVTQILFKLYEFDGDVCVFELIAPGWKFCKRQSRSLTEVLRCSRTDTYIVPGTGRGCIRTSFDHDRTDYLRLPILKNPLAVKSLSRFYDREIFREWATNSLIIIPQAITRFSNNIWGPLLPQLAPAVRLLRDPKMALRLLPYADDDEAEARTKYRLPPLPPPDPDQEGNETENQAPRSNPPTEQASPTPRPAPEFIYSRIRHLMLTTSPETWFLQAQDIIDIPDRASPSAQEAFEVIHDCLDFERAAYLHVDWRQLSSLEMLFLDCRGYSHGVIERREIVDLARALRSSGMPLRLLVIAGLRSYHRYPGSEALTIDEVESGVPGPEQDVVYNDSGNGVNWWLMFRRAVRPGGRLIFIDKRFDHD